MKHSLLRLSILALLLTVKMIVFAFEVDGINYEITSNLGKTAEVVSKYPEYSESVIIPEVVSYNGNTYSVTSIGHSAFEGCSGLTSVTSLNTIPPVIMSSTFEETTEKNATLNVPIGCKNIYWLHPYWENFTKIEEIDVSGISNTILNNKYDDNIYNPNGIKVNGNNLGKGIYIKNRKKVIIK